MGLNAQKGVITAPLIDALPVTVNLPAGFDLKALIFFCTLATAEGITDGHGIFGLGYATKDGGTIQQRCYAAFDTDAVGTSDTARLWSDSSTLVLLSSVSAIDMEMDVTTFSPEQFVCTFTAAPNSATRIHYLALGGSDITAARAFDFNSVTSPSTQDVTIAAGFGQPDLLMLSGPPASSEAANTIQAAAHVGLAISKSGAEQGVAMTAPDALTTMGTGVMAQSDALVRAGDTAVQVAASLSAKSAWPTDGFELTYAVQTTALKVIGLALKGPFTSTIGVGTVPTSGALPVTQNLANSTPPKAAIIFGLRETANPAVGGTANSGSFAIGASDGTNEGSCGVQQDDGNTNSIAGRFHSESKVYRNVAFGNPPTMTSECDASFSGNNVVLSWNDIDASAFEYRYLLLGAAAGTQYTRDATATLAPVAADGARVASIEAGAQPLSASSRESALGVVRAATLANPAASRVREAARSSSIALGPDAGVLRAVVQAPRTAAATVAGEATAGLLRTLAAAASAPAAAAVLRALDVARATLTADAASTVRAATAASAASSPAAATAARATTSGSAALETDTATLERSAYPTVATSQAAAVTLEASSVRSLAASALQASLAATERAASIIRFGAVLSALVRLAAANADRTAGQGASLQVEQSPTRVASASSTPAAQGTAGSLADRGAAAPAAGALEQQAERIGAAPQGSAGSLTTAGQVFERAASTVQAILATLAALPARTVSTSVAAAGSIAARQQRALATSAISAATATLIRSAVTFLRTLTGSVSTSASSSRDLATSRAALAAALPALATLLTATRSATQTTLATVLRHLLGGLVGAAGGRIARILLAGGRLLQRRPEGELGPRETDTGGTIRRRQVGGSVRNRDT